MRKIEHAEFRTNNARARDEIRICIAGIIRSGPAQLGIVFGYFVRVVLRVKPLTGLLVCYCKNCNFVITAL
jgi:hypothetical protein